MEECRKETTTMTTARKRVKEVKAPHLDEMTRSKARSSYAIALFTTRDLMDPLLHGCRAIKAEEMSSISTHHLSYHNCQGQNEREGEGRGRVLFGTRALLAEVKKTWK